MTALEQLFATAELDVVVPDTSLEYPPTFPADEWLSRLKSGALERNQAFFDEQLHSLLTVRVAQPADSSSTDPALPPKELLAFLTHLQVTLEATYISTVPVGLGVPETPRTARLGPPPRTATLGAKLSVRPSHPSIYPPNTPNPTPSSAETDKRYLKSEGTLLLASIWGQNQSPDSQEAFSLLWSQEEQVWVAVYRLSLTVAFLRLPINEPVLCLTISATLRERPQTLSQPNHPLSKFLKSVDFLEASTVPTSPTSPTANGTPSTDEPTLSGLPELNLFQGLSAGPTFDPSALDLPTARLGSVSRLKLFTLQPLPARTPLSAPSPSPMTAVGRSAAGGGPATLRKSFRKTLRTVSGFRVRMRTVFVPAVLIPGVKEETDEDPEAGTDERTVVLCVELENSGDSGRTVGFEIERVEVNVGSGDDAGARAILVSWENNGGAVFPLRVGPNEQYNLLYAVSFLRSPDEALAMGLAKDGAPDMLQRAVTIGVFGKPFLPSEASFVYPTRTFCSKWNCVLDLSSQPRIAPEDDYESDTPIPNVLPEPASPFPSSPNVRTDSLILRDSPPPMLDPAAKRHTLPGGQPIVAARALGLKGYRSSTSMLNPLNARDRGASSPPIPVRSASLNQHTPNQYTPPSITAQIPRSPTTYTAPPRLAVDPDYQAPVPMTPAYPAYPTRSAMPPTPPAVMAQSFVQGHHSGKSVEIRRERGMPMGTGAAGVPQTPGPIVSVGGDGGGMWGLGPSVSEIHEEDEHEDNGVKNGEAIVVSVGLVSSGARKGEDLGKTTGSRDGDELRRIYPLDHFTLDVFVFNQTDWTRRFEVTCPDRRRRGRNPGENAPSPGIVPLDNRVRIGPLLPAACQSVRMEFLAVTPGVHSIDTLTLTDVVSGHSMNLRSVMDIVVHEP
ncbi:TRAPP trafficking subunit Trs65-domain-containing protein [Roridomyces roridus]|uniref:TRAPP trafficking subunit Trs65-domain-containing protein n=1 Tax=Roridomyces roridus TaxID=1738132 RepID=A0AAD7FV97_9AGAR|nr:TRAPP trafficking subunit Trs65-domain-containing protein [Roridomyces roridus]